MESTYEIVMNFISYPKMNLIGYLRKYLGVRENEDKALSILGIMKNANKWVKGMELLHEPNMTFPSPPARK